MPIDIGVRYCIFNVSTSSHDMVLHVQKWGNSLAVRIPKAFAEEAHIAHGTEVDISLKRGDLVIRPLASPKVDLASLVARINPDNRHGEVDWGPPVGKEAW